MSVWLEEKMRSIAEKKQSSKYNPYCVRDIDKLGRLMSEIKAKRESLVAKAGFPTTIGAFLANSHFNWIPTNLHLSARLREKKKLWKPGKKSSKNTHLSYPAAASSNSKIPTAEVCHDQHVGQTVSTEEINGIDGSVVHEQRAPPGLDMMYRRVFTVIVVAILSLSPILEAKKAALGITTLAFFFFRVVITRRNSSYSANLCLKLIHFLDSVTANLVLSFIHIDRPFPFLENSPLNPKSRPSESKICVPAEVLGKQQRSSSAYPTSILPTCQNFVAKAECPGFCAPAPKDADSIGNSRVHDVKKPRSKLLRKLVCRRCSSAPNSPNTKNGTELRSISFSHSARPSPASSPEPSEKAEMGKGKMPYHSDSDLQTKVRGEPVSQALEFRYLKSNSGWVITEKISNKEKKCGKIFSLFLLIVVLFGLMAGRLPALVCALSWCLFMKALEIERKS